MNEKKDLDALLDKIDGVKKEMYDALYAIVEAHGGLVRTENGNNGIIRDSIYAIVFDEGEEQYVDERVLAVAVIDGQLHVYTDPTKWVTTVKDVSDEDLLADLVAWYPIYGGMVWVAPTLESLCEGIGQYVD